MNVLFMCCENASLSMIAQVWAERAGLSSRSAGTRPAMHADALTVDVMLGAGVNLSRRTPRRVQDDDLAWADMVITMQCDLARLPECGVQSRQWQVGSTEKLNKKQLTRLADDIRELVEALASEARWGTMRTTDLPARLMANC